MKNLSYLRYFLDIEVTFEMKSKKQYIISQFSIETEYRAITSTTKEIIWLHWLLVDMRVSLSHPTLMYCDNQCSIQIAHNLIFYERIKCIEIDCHFTRHHLKHDTITLPFVFSSLQITDFFTMSHFIYRFRFCFLTGKLSMLIVVASWVWGEMLRNTFILFYLLRAKWYFEFNLYIISLYLG